MAGLRNRRCAGSASQRELPGQIESPIVLRKDLSASSVPMHRMSIPLCLRVSAARERSPARVRLTVGDNYHRIQFRKFCLLSSSGSRQVCAPTNDSNVCSALIFFFEHSRLEPLGSVAIAARSPKIASAVAHPRRFADRAKSTAPCFACAISAPCHAARCIDEQKRTSLNGLECLSAPPARLQAETAFLISVRAGSRATFDSGWN